MSREIKFRAWVKRKNELIYLKGFRYSGNEKIKITFADEDKDDCTYTFLNSEVVLEQFTGLYDKNGVKIYEGDRCIVERPCVGAVGITKFHQGCFIFVENYTENILRLCDLKLNNYTIEVIGNIHEKENDK